MSLASAGNALWAGLRSSAVRVRYKYDGGTSDALYAVPSMRKYAVETADGLIESFQICDWTFPAADLVIGGQVEMPERYGLIQTIDVDGVVTGTYEINLPDGVTERHVNWLDSYHVLLRVHTVEVT